MSVYPDIYVHSPCGQRVFSYAAGYCQHSFHRGNYFGRTMYFVLAVPPLSRNVDRGSFGVFDEKFVVLIAFADHCWSIHRTRHCGLITVVRSTERVGIGSLCCRILSGRYCYAYHRERAISNHRVGNNATNSMSQFTQNRLQV